MALTLSTSLATAVARPGVQIQTLVEIDTADGTILLAAEDQWWSGQFYRGRVLNPGEVAADLGAPESGIGALKTVAIELANADGAYSGKRPSYFRGKSIRVKEILTDVPSTPLRMGVFTVAAVAMGSPDRIRIEGEDITSVWRRNLWPPVTITPQLFPALQNTSFGDQSAVGKPLPIVYGRVYCPLYFIDQRPSLSGDGTLDTVWAGPLGLVASYGNVVEQFPPAVAGAINFGSPVISATVTSLSYGGFIITAAQIAGQVPQNFVRWVDVTGTATPTPGEVLTDVLQHSAYGAFTRVAGVASNTILDSVSLQSAFSYYATNSVVFDAAIVTQRTLDEWLASWQHDAQCRLITRSNQLVLVPQNSRAPTFSLHAGNIVGRTLTMEDVPFGQEVSQRGVTFVDRRADPTSGPTTVFFSAGSGGLQIVNAPFIGRASVAMQAAARWAKQEAYGVRRYGVQVTVKGGATIEEGDLGTLTHSLVAASGQLVECTGITRTGGVYTVAVRETALAVFANPTLPADTVPGSPFYYQRVPFTFKFNTVLVIPETDQGSHQLGVTPTRMFPVWKVNQPTISWSFTPPGLGGNQTTNASVYTFALTDTVVSSPLKDPRGEILAWDLYV